MEVITAEWKSRHAFTKQVSLALLFSHLTETGRTPILIIQILHPDTHSSPPTKQGSRDQNSLPHLYKPPVPRC